MRRLRDARGMTQAELAERVGLGRTSMTNLERGNQNPPLSMLPLLARGLGVSASQLIAELDAPHGDFNHNVLTAHVHDEALRSWASKLISHDSSEPTEDRVRTLEATSQ